VFEGIRRIFSITELKEKIVFTLLMLVACRIGAHVPVPGINGDAAVNLFRYATGGGQNLFQLMDVFSGGAFAHMTVIALGVMPYITASIIMQLLMALIPSLQKEIKENLDAGRRKLSRWIRFLTVGIAFFQAGLFAKYAVQLNAGSPGIIVSEIYDIQFFGFPWLFYLVVMMTMTAGTVLLMWIGEQITERGVGNGISLIIALGILSSLPMTLGSVVGQLNLDSQEPGQMTFSSLVVLTGVFVVIIIGTILIIQGQRRVPLQYARRNISSYDTEKTAYIPLKINYAGVIPVIFASSLLMFPATLAQFVGKNSWFSTFINLFSPGNWVHRRLCGSHHLFYLFLDSHAISS